MLVPAEQLTGYVRKDMQVKWLDRHGYKHNESWWEQRTNGKIVVLLIPSEAPEPEQQPDLSSLGQKTQNRQAPAKVRVSAGREISGTQA